MGKLAGTLVFLLILMLQVSFANFSPFFSPMPLGTLETQKTKNLTLDDGFSSLALQKHIDQVRSGFSNALTGGYNPELRSATYLPEKLLSPGKDQKSDSDLVFFYSSKDISMLEPCTRHNYLLAFDQIDGKIIKSGASFNFNAYLANLRGYCTGRGEKHFTFYGGVCGVASQLFRASLSSPQVRIDKRRGHNNRYSKYYGSEVRGDDAAVYERNKQFSFTNTSAYPFLIKTHKKGNITYLFFITFKKAVKDQRVEISKVKKSPLAVDIQKTVYQTSGFQKTTCKNQISPLFSPHKRDCEQKNNIQTINTQIFQSRYFQIQERSL